MKKRFKSRRWISLIGLIITSSTLWGIASVRPAATTSINSNSKIKLHQAQAAAPAPSATSTEADGTYIYRPSSLTFTPRTAGWTAKYPSQVTAADISAMFNLQPQTVSDGQATATNSGYQFQKVDASGKGTKVEISGLNAEVSHFLGQLSNNQLRNLNIEFVNVDDVKGTLNFRVYQPLSAYQLSSNVPTNTQLNSSNNSYRALILPPTDKKDTSDATLWKWDESLTLNKVKFTFRWNSNANIISYINQLNTKSSTVTEEAVKTNFFVVTPDFVPPYQTLKFPTPTVTLTPTDNLGRLNVAVTLNDEFSNTDKSFSRTFLGFQTDTQDAVQSGVQLHILSDEQLTQSIIKLPLWDQTQPDGTVTSFTNKKVGDLLPTQFLNARNADAKYKNYSLLDLITGKKIDTSNKVVPKVPQTLTASGADAAATEQKTDVGIAPLELPTSIAGFQNEIAYLTLAGDRAKTGKLTDLPEFKITEVRGVANDRVGIVDLLIYYQTLDNAAELVQAAPMHVRYKGFNANPNSGSSLLFSWNSSLPTDLATLSSDQIFNTFKNQIGNNNYAGSFINDDAAKLFVSRFFTSSTYFSDEFYKRYEPNLNQGAQVSVEQVQTSSNSSEADSIKISIKMANFNGMKEHVLTNIFLAHQSVVNIPHDKVSTIEPLQEFLLRNHRFANRFASSLTDEEILEMFQLTIPNGGEIYTDPLSTAKVFAIANDQDGQLIVILLLPKFNGVENYEYNFRINNFRQNEALENGLSLTHVPEINLPATFLARNPLDPSDLTTSDILDNLFSSLPIAIARLLNANDLTIVERGENYVVVNLRINWRELLNRTNNSLEEQPNSRTNNQTNQNPNNETDPAVTTPANRSTTTSTTSTNLVHHEDELTAVDNSSSDETSDGKNQVLRFVINGFLGKNGFQANNQSPVAQIPVLDDAYIAVIGVIVTTVLAAAAAIKGTLFYRRRKYYTDGLEPEPSSLSQKNKTNIRSSSSDKNNHHRSQIKNKSRQNNKKTVANYRADDWGKI
ncbi:hypothetical protein J2Z62_000025 [Mycoplasmoides fastidiosum]|uniref:Uncharacterized protein n=1 Tax=Mycoplasmoides fastidiosum TaxID=92758 RepID=A0ABU0LY28_9BACT|nr:hypothetical protein [Mycoplasmoides fastidiosum]MDQ0513587.1 hypothetical protein [Mycoplasmoides fastidiosum]UUD37990.1 hypothetical protein NPA10_01170 [Mycoplasmoides fastidiosum]